MMATAIERVVASAGIGHNSASEPTALEAFASHVDDLFDAAKQFLDGEPITTEQQAAAVAKLKEDALRAEKDGTAARMAETKPLDEAKKAIMEQWRPLVDKDAGKCRLIVSTCQKALTPWLEAKEAERRAVAEAAKREAEELAAAAHEALQAAHPADLAAVEEANALLKTATRAEATASRADKARAQAKGGERAVGLRSVWAAEIVDQRAALNHYIKSNPGDFTALIQWLADFEAKHGPRTAPGIKFNETKTAV